MTLLIGAQTIPLHSDAQGVMRVGASRVTLDTVIHAFEQGHTPEEITSRYPALKLADVYSVIAYYLNHRNEVGEYLAQQESATETLWTQIEANCDYQRFRNLLLTGHRSQSNGA